MKAFGTGNFFREQSRTQRLFSETELGKLKSVWHDVDGEFGEANCKESVKIDIFCSQQKTQVSADLCWSSSSKINRTDSVSFQKHCSGLENMVWCHNPNTMSQWYKRRTVGKARRNSKVPSKVKRVEALEFVTQRNKKTLAKWFCEEWNNPYFLQQHFKILHANDSRGPEVGAWNSADKMRMSVWGDLASVLFSIFIFGRQTFSCPEDNKKFGAHDPNPCWTNSNLQGINVEFVQTSRDSGRQTRCCSAPASKFTPRLGLAFSEFSSETDHYLGCAFTGVSQSGNQWSQMDVNPVRNSFTSSW